MRGISRRGVMAAAFSLPAVKAFARQPPLSFSGPFRQGGAVVARTTPRARFTVDGTITGVASENGLFVIGLDRDAAATCKVAVAASDARVEREMPVSPVSYDIQRIDGLPQQTVTPEGDAVLAKIAAEAERKREGYASLADADWFADGFTQPLAQYRISGRFGGQRILNGVPNTPHYGADLAAPRGAPILSPAPGLVSFAETGLHFEGGLVFIDHGQGLISAYLHMSRIDVRKGQEVRRGQTIGLVGAEGRATGPHLCWRLKWRGRNLDPTLFVGVRAPPAVA